MFTRDSRRIGVYAVPFEEGVMKTSVAIAIPPKYLTFEREETTYRGRVDLTGRIVDDKGTGNSAHRDSPAVKLSGEEFDKAKAFSFPIYSTHFSFRENTISICFTATMLPTPPGKLEKSFEVPEPPDQMELIAPLLALQVDFGCSAGLAVHLRQPAIHPERKCNVQQRADIDFLLATGQSGEKAARGKMETQDGVANHGTNVLELQEDLPVSTNGQFAN